MNSKIQANASSEASTKNGNNNVPAQVVPANPDKAITLVALTPDDGTANVAAFLFPKEDSSSAPQKTELSKEEESSLERLEKVIESGLKTFVEVGAALYEIQSQRLYRRKHDSFEAYLATRWNFKRAHAYRLINAYRVLETIRDEDGKELAESHVRQLVRLPEDQRAEALRRAKELAGEGTRTGKHIQQVVDAMLGKQKKTSGPKSTDEEKGTDDGGTPAAEAPTPTTPTGGTAAPLEAPGTPQSTDSVPVTELLAMIRETRDLLTMKGDVKAAIQQLFRMEQVLTRQVGKGRYTSLVVDGTAADEVSSTFKGRITEHRQLQAA